MDRANAIRLGIRGARNVREVGRIYSYADKRFLDYWLYLYYEPNFGDGWAVVSADGRIVDRASHWRLGSYWMNRGVPFHNQLYFEVQTILVSEYFDTAITTDRQQHGEEVLPYEPERPKRKARRR